MLGIIFTLLFLVIGIIDIFKGGDRELLGLYYLLIASMWYIGTALWQQVYKKKGESHGANDNNS